VPALLDERPVVVLGAGPVGQTTALLLAHWGVRVVVVDPRPERDLVGSKAICQQRDVLDVWETVGAGRRLADEGVTWTTARTFHRGDELFAVQFQDRGRSPFPPFVNVSQSRTEQVLDERLAQSPLVEVRWGCEAVGIDQDDDGVRIRCTTSGGESVLSAPYVVACTGARGDAVRRMLGLAFEGSTFGDQFLICDVRTDLPGWERERRFYFDPDWNPGRQVLIHPCPDATFRIDWQVPPDFDLDVEEASGRLDTRVRQVIGDRPYELVWKSVYRFHSRVVDRMQVGPVLVAGDAAHLVSPFGARGLNSGVLDAENAVWKLAFVLRGWAPASLLASYHDERHAAAVENLEVTGATMRFLVPQDDAERARRQSVLERSRTDDDARAQVDSGRLAEPFWYVDSPLTTPDPSRPFAGRPANGHVPAPAPGVLLPDCPVTCQDRPDVVRLRQLLRRGLTLLAGDDVDLDELRRALDGTPAEVEVRRMSDLAPELAGILDARPDEVWLVRPDAHVAAVVPGGSVQATGHALRRLLALPVPLPL
jgi:3-(3-hydroxy-phenyl)propionate hydroxylase